MESRTYRVMVGGQFAGLNDQLREALLGSLGDVRLQFSEAGNLWYDRSLYAFTYRFQIEVDAQTPEDADVEAQLLAEERAIADLTSRGLSWRNLRITGSTCLDDMRVHRPSRLNR